MGSALFSLITARLSPQCLKASPSFGRYSEVNERIRQ